MASLRQIFRYTPSQLFAVVSDVRQYPQFVPFCTGARILSEKYHAAPSQSPQTNDTYLMDVELSVGFLAFQESYVSKVTCRPNELVEVSWNAINPFMYYSGVLWCWSWYQVAAESSTPLFKSLNTIWRFQKASTQSPHPQANQPYVACPSQPAGMSQGDDAGPTLVSLDLAFAFSSPLHAAVSATFFGQVSKMMVKAFEQRCLTVYGHGTQ